MKNNITYKTINEQYKAVERLLCQNDLIHLAEKYIVPRLERNMLNPELHGRVARMIRNNRECLILLPRGFGKTTFFTEIQTVQDIMNNPNGHFAIVTHSFRKATEILDHIKQYLKLPALAKLFPEILWGPKIPNDVEWRRDAIRVKQTIDGVGNTVEVFGIEQDVTGSHYNKITFDDIVQRSNSNTPDAIDKVKRAFATYSPIIKAHNSKRVIVGTRYKLDDLYGDLIKQKVPYILEQVETDGVFLDENIINAEQLEIKKKEIVNMYGISFFYSQYYNKTIAEEDVKFKPEWVTFYDDNVEIRPSTVFILCDPAIGRSKRSDECVVITIAQTKDGKIYVLSSEGRKEDVKETAYRIYYEWKYWSKKAPVKVGIETGGYQAALLQRTEELQHEKGIYFDIVELKPKGRAKEGRITNLVPYFKNKNIKLNKGCKKLYEQLIYYGATTHDDHVDILAYLTDLLEETGGFDILNIFEEDDIEESYKSAY